MEQEIKKMLYQKTSKEFYHHMKFWKSIMNRTCSIKKLFLKILQYLQENTYVGVSFLMKVKAFNPEHVFVYCDAFIFTISFLMSLLSLLNRFHALIYFFCY